MDGEEVGVLNANSSHDFRIIYDATMPLLYKISLRIVNDMEAAEDLAHDALIKANERSMSFPSINDAKYWLIRVVKNASFNYVKRKGRERNAYKKVLYESKTHNARTGEREYLEKESIKTVQNALKVLPDKLKEVIVLKEYSDLNYKEIGSILGISEGNVKVRIFRARKELQALIGGDNVIMPNG